METNEIISKIWEFIAKVKIKHVSLIISLLAAVFVYQSNDIASQAYNNSAVANSIASQANNNSVVALAHEMNTQESTIRVGMSSSTVLNDGINNSIFMFRIPLINGYYARYPASVMGDKIDLIFNGDSVDLRNTLVSFPQSPANFLVFNDQPRYIDFVFGNISINGNIFREYSSDIFLNFKKENLKVKDNTISMGFPYLDFSSDNFPEDFKYIKIDFQFNYDGTNVTDTKRTVNYNDYKVTVYQVNLTTT
ncbi:MAG: hypothetical protein OI860_00225 (plasmid) [Candidatus Methanoperedens sp.]|uniref:hypothetical protein n=1 Tax=Candidatus Methanoperedens sp. BLZ2 TaxID=2035255 RepID=UPI000BE37B27|nr:hypothetical protein [Candidatus Methanoperedens sp. BLZ2]KAB2946438.1 MAG: hypothetical protein F9K14_07585 [Candidatus Methanoperedens sp.]MBZ0175674.1 hypothetical protein [Candidatus Methanoperedens nitroreducens]WAH95056.1 MAG: hypothetical protein OI863_00240 [Candidatus Methanoperedens sp.]WAM22222.1 MAG: hypothetical protein OI860_00225 [Candidatus Methanoperedens sp.]